MNARQKVHQIHLKEWASRFSDQKASGLTVKQWCDQNHLSVHAYNYWKHILKEEVAGQFLPEIVPLPLPVSAAMPNQQTALNRSFPDYSNHANCTNRAIAKLSAGDVVFEFDSSVSEEFLCTLIRAVRHA